MFKLKADAVNMCQKGFAKSVLDFGMLYLFWLAVIVSLYWYGLPALPYKDHPTLMYKKMAFESDWEWFLTMLSYNRSSISPGDTFLFRPAHMAVLALQDIFLRHHLTAQGVVNCLQFCFAATLFFSISKRFAGALAATALTVLWVPQLAGVTMVIWQHITPYIICPAFLLLALLLLDGDILRSWPKTKTIISAIFILISSLTHEIGAATALSVSCVTLLFGGQDTARRKQILQVFLFPLVVYAIINMLDYHVVNPVPEAELSEIIYSRTNLADLVKFVGAIGIALFASPALNLVSDFQSAVFPRWDFMSEPSLQLYAMALVVFALLMYSSYNTCGDIKANGISRLSLLNIALLSFFAATFAGCFVRIYTRGPDYMSTALYYYALFGLSLSGLMIGMISAINNARTKNIILVSMIVFGCLHSFSLHKYLKASAPIRSYFNTVVSKGRKIFDTNSDLCYGKQISASNNEIWDYYFHEFVCEPEDKLTTLYLTRTKGQNILWLSSFNSNQNISIQLFP